jgi:hypothetical protein
VPQGGSAGQALVKTDGTDYNTEWADIAVDTQYHNRFETDAETFRSGATDTVELYYTAKADGDGLAESASSDTPTAGKVIKRKIYYSEAAFADPDTGTWVEFTPAPADDASFATVKAALLEYLKARTGGTVPISLKQTWEEVTAAPAFTGLLNETYGSGAEAAYSTRRLNGNVTECMVIRRASDSTTTTIGFDGSGNIDESAIETFCTGTTCTVSEWKDQSGNGNTATAPSTGDEPTIYTGGAIVKENGKPAIDFNNDKLHAAFNYSVTAQSTYGLGVFVDGASDRFLSQVELGQTIDYNGDEYIQGYRSATNTISALRDNAAQSSILVSNNTRILFTSEHTGSVLKNYVSGYGGSAYSNTLNNTFTKLLIKSSTGPSGEGMAGTMQEVLMYTSDKSTDRTDIEENIGDYFTQNTPLLDTYSGAAAAYSLRLLDSTYTGSAIRVRRSSDNTEQDIGFNVFGELDTVSLLDFAGTGDAFVKTWYDQSGNSNDATQTATGSQPQIVSSGAVEVDANGKPAVKFDGSNDVLFTSNTSINVGSQRNDFAVTTLFQNTFWGVFNMDNLGGGRLEQNIRGNSTAHTIGFTTGGSAIVTQGATTLTLNQQYLFSAELDGTDLSIYVDGTVDGTLTQSSQKTGTSNLAIGTAGGTSSGRLQGYIQEVITYQANQSDNRTNIESNIATFYGITL